VGASNLRVSCAALLLSVCLGAPAGALAQAAPAGKYSGSAHEAAARQLMRSRRGADEAYRLLAPLEGRYAGDTDFDYALGTSALDSGRYSHAVFALQRAVAARPGFAGARMDLARAYYALGDNESARREFAILQRDDPPPQAQRAIVEYLDAIDRRAAAYRRQVSGYAELGSGYDSNANGAPDIQTFIGIPLDSRNQASSSSYYNLGVGGLVSHPFAPGWRVAGTGTAGYRGNPDATFVDAQTLQLAGAVEWRPGTFELSLRPNFAMALLDGEDNHQVAGIDAAATWHSARSQFSLNLRSSQTRYAEDLEVLDVDTVLFGVAALYTPRSMPRVQVVSAVTLGSDDAVTAGSPYGRDLTAGRVGAVIGFGHGHAMAASVGTLSSEYDGQFFVPGGRDDDQTGVTLGYEWSGLRARGWTLRAQVSYVDNASTVALYDYDRIDAGVSMRKEFR